MDRIILHSDLNGFYASVECFHNPKIRNLPVAVGGDVEKRHGIILAKNEIAKRYGVKTGDAIWQALQKCPNLVCVKPNFKLYMEYSRLVREIYYEYTDRVEPFGLDECWLDITAQCGLFGDGEKVANEIRKKVYERLGVTVSVGVSWNKIYAKLGSDIKKPDATTVISRENYKEVAWTRPVDELLYVGRATNRKMRNFGIKTIGDLAETDPQYLRKALGKNGYTLWVFANGMDPAAVSKIGHEPMVKSVGNSTTAPRDLDREDEVRVTLYVLCESVASRMRDHNVLAKTAQVTFRDKDLFSYQRQMPLPHPTCLSNHLFDAAMALYRENHLHGKPLRSIGVRGCNLIPNENLQLSFLAEHQAARRREDLERAIDGLRERFGHEILQRAVMMTDGQLSHLNPKAEHTIHPVSYFR